MTFPQDSFSSQISASLQAAAARWGIASSCSTTLLSGDWEALVHSLPGLGEVRCITQNAALRHERVGRFEAIDFYSEIGVILGEEIDLRLFMDYWRIGAALLEETPKGTRRSLLFADAEGTPVLQIALEPGADVGAYEALVKQHTLAEGETSRVTPPRHPAFEPLKDEQVDVKGFRKAWLEMEDTASFQDMLRSFGVRREQGLRLAPEGYARRVRPDATRFVLETARLENLRIMIFGRSAGCLQIHTGAIRHLAIESETQLTIDEPRFRLQLDTSAIATAWVVLKPTIDGLITSLELFDAKGNNVALLFGKRGYGQPEDERWRRILSHLI